MNFHYRKLTRISYVGFLCFQKKYERKKAQKIVKPGSLRSSDILFKVSCDYKLFSVNLFNVDTVFSKLIFICVKMCDDERTGPKRDGRRVMAVNN